MIAQRFGQDPRAVALWEPEWLVAASTAMAAEAGAQAELQKRHQRRARMRRPGA